MTTQLTEKRLHKQSSVQSSASSNEAATGLGPHSGLGSGAAGNVGGPNAAQGHRQHEIVAEIAPEEVTTFFSFYFEIWQK